MTDPTDAEWEAILKHTPALQEGFIAGRLGLPGSPLMLDTQWGPIEGTKDGNTIRWTLPNHEWIEVRLLPGEALEMYRNDRLVARIGPTQIEPDDEEDGSEDSPGP